MGRPRYKITPDNIETALHFYCMGKAYAHSSRTDIENLVEHAANCPELRFMDDIEALLESDLQYVYSAIEASSHPQAGSYRWSDNHTSQAHVLDFILAANIPSWKLMYDIAKTRQIVKNIRSRRKIATSKTAVL